ncbi:hypothetical protein PanWU01x14_134050, partial [Parasponia andersonii]
PTATSSEIYPHLKKKAVAERPGSPLIGCFLDFSGHVGPSNSWNYMPSIGNQKKALRGCCVVWCLIAQARGTHRRDWCESSLKAKTLPFFLSLSKLQS